MSADRDPWTFAKLFRVLRAPQRQVPGTKMSFVGLRSTAERIDLVAYLGTQSDSPLPIPAASKQPPSRAIILTQSLSKGKDARPGTYRETRACCAVGPGSARRSRSAWLG